jgi:glucan 1,3-beta-glucosidase
MRLSTVLLAAASLVSTVQGHWLGNIPRMFGVVIMLSCEKRANVLVDRGFAPFAGQANYPVFRNVKDYGARGA